MKAPKLDKTAPSDSVRRIVRPEVFCVTCSAPITSETHLKAYVRGKLEGTTPAIYCSPLCAKNHDPSNLTLGVLKNMLTITGANRGNNNIYAK